MPQSHHHISRTTNNPIIERRTCTISGQQFPIFQSDADFLARISPTFDGTTFQLTLPTLCPDERARHRLLRRNERNFYRRTCDATGTSMISVYHPDTLGPLGKPLTIYKQDTRRSDKRNPLDYGQARNPNTPFREQFAQLMQVVPRPNIINRNSSNSQYTNISAYNRDCYMLVESSNNRDCYHCYRIQKSADLLDCSFCNDCQVAYQCSDCEQSSHLFYCQQCVSCSFCYHSIDCKGCSYCIGCHGLRNQSYQICNQAVSKDEYLQSLHDLQTNNPRGQALRQRIHDLHQAAPRPAMTLDRCENCHGNYMTDAKNCHYCYEIHDTSDCHYSCHVRFNSHHCMDVDTVGYNCSYNYQCINTALDSTNNIGCARCRTVSNCIYCNECDNCNDCFACIGLRNKQYCILNQQYTEQQYEKTVADILTQLQQSPLSERDGARGGGYAQWGSFLPSSLSPFPYNHTIAHTYYPLNPQQAQQRSYKRYDDITNKTMHNHTDTIHGSDLPTSYYISSTSSNDPLSSDNLTSSAMICTTTGKPYRFIKPELAFYAKHKLPLPPHHPDTRHAHRIANRPPRHLHLRSCDSTGQQIVSVYSSDVSFDVYSKQAYIQHIGG